MGPHLRHKRSGTAAHGRAQRPTVGHGGPRSGTAAHGRARRPDPTVIYTR
ncbi:MAG: hypothetical protein KDD73_03695 [Anaerolineales bacterium]|nr:hypothetical protein [Anaerolineales bacterium]